MERSFINLTEDSIEYFKEQIVKCYLANSIENKSNQTIRKTISNLINTFIRLGGVEMWPEILEFLFKNLDQNAEMSLETLNIIIEDSGSHLEDKFGRFLNELLEKLLKFLNDMGSKDNSERNDNMIIQVLITIHILLENCPNLINDVVEAIATVLTKLEDSQNPDLRCYLGKCFLAMVRMKNEVLSAMTENLFGFFYKNLTQEHYQMNFTSAEFFLLLVDDEADESLLNNEKLYDCLSKNVKT